MNVRNYLATSSLTVLGLLLSAGTAQAQSIDPAAAAPAVAAADPGEGDIVVTGSRISMSGYSQPTPVTIVDEAAITRDAKPSIGDVIRELPAVGTSLSPNNGVGLSGIVSGAQGLDTINLRQLGYLRTLVLFDGQRVVQSNITGQIDIATIPTALVQRIDVVTAGASATWGSDAVAGVVNLVLNKKFEGVRLSADYGDSTTWDHRNYRVQMAAGTSFAEDRGHVIVAANYSNSPQPLFGKQRSWNKYSALMENPAYTAANGEPQYIHVNNIGLSQATTGGLIVSGPLKGIQFVGPNATPIPFDFGQVSGPLSYGGDAEQFTATLHNLAIPFEATTAFGYGSYEFTDWLKASVQLNYGETRSHNSSPPVTRFGNVNIRADNAFLPQSIRTQMANLGLATIPVGTTNLNNLAMGEDYSFDRIEGRTVAIPTAITKRRLKRGVLSLYGDLGGDWSWNAYYQHGEVRVRQDVINNLIPGNYDRAVDAVVAPAGNAAGIAPGTIVCRSTLTNPNNGCSPLNIFGTGVASAAAIAYVNVKPGQNYQIQELTEDAFAASVQGVLPFGLPAGDVAVAAGFEHRREKGVVTADPGAIARLYSLGNFAPFEGKYVVKEGFAEIDVPLLKDSLVQSLSFNAAGRLTDYSTSGSVLTWKLGLTSQVNDDIRFRGTISRDIRAPNLNELFSDSVATSGSAIDPNTGANVPIFVVRSGNIALRPEVARTYSAGVVLTPRAVSGLTVSVDYYKISIRDAISTISQAQVLSRCVAGEAIFCDQLVFGGPAGVLSQINLVPLNVATEKVSGVDFQADYRRPVFAGTLSARLTGNYIIGQSQNQLGVTIKYAGGVGLDNPISGVPRARANLALTYDQDNFSFTAQARFIGAAKLVNTWTSKDVDRNHVPAIAYFDLRGSYKLNDKVELFGTVDNLLNQAPPVLPATSKLGQNVYFTTAARGDIYDMIGRAYRVGARLRF